MEPFEVVEEELVESLPIEKIEFTGKKYTLLVSGEVNYWSILENRRLDLGWISRMKIKGLKPACVYKLYIHGVRIGEFNGNIEIDFANWMQRVKTDLITTFDMMNRRIEPTEYYKNRLNDKDLQIGIFLQIINEITYNADCMYDFDTPQWYSVNFTQVSVIKLICDCGHKVTNENVRVIFYKNESIE